MTKFTTSLAGFALAGLVLVGAGCGGNTPSDLNGTWNIDPESEAAEALEGTTFEFTDGNTMTMSIEFLGETATMAGTFEETELGTNADQAEADFAIRFSEFQLSAPGEEETLTGDEAPFGDVHVQLSEDGNKVTLFEDTLDSADNAVLIRSEE